MLPGPPASSPTSSPVLPISLVSEHPFQSPRSCPDSELSHRLLLTPGGFSLPTSRATSSFKHQLKGTFPALLGQAGCFWLCSSVAPFPEIDVSVGLATLGYMLPKVRGHVRASSLSCTGKVWGICREMTRGRLPGPSCAPLPPEVAEQSRAAPGPHPSLS